MNESAPWKSGLASLRSRFERGASDFPGIRCFLCRESYNSGNPPLATALSKAIPQRALRPIIGQQADGIVSYHAGWISSQEEFYHWWLVHERLRRAMSHAAHFSDHAEVDVASKAATKCEQEFVEIADEAAQLLARIPSLEHKELKRLLDSVKLSCNHTLWIVALFCIAKHKPVGTALRTSLIFPEFVSFDLRSIDSAQEVPESVIQILECNPFSASVALIDFLLANITDPDGPCGAYQWRHCGHILEENMSPGSWKLVHALWNQPERKSTFDQLVVPIYDDPEHIAESSAFGSLRRAANNSFKANGIPYSVSLKKTTVSLKKVE